VEHDHLARLRIEAQPPAREPSEGELRVERIARAERDPVAVARHHLQHGPIVPAGARPEPAGSAEGREPLLRFQQLPLERLVREVDGRLFAHAVVADLVPAATIRRTSASRPATRSPSRKKVAWAP
jgi:hypothetical protein